jgi:hypothetical protein
MSENRYYETGMYPVDKKQDLDNNDEEYDDNETDTTAWDPIFNEWVELYPM